jgi:hypothetical protein
MAPCSPSRPPSNLVKPRGIMAAWKALQDISVAPDPQF